ncbi:protein nessun dorma-like [Sabethes cyaneus]|uniref:protein nessun dorma-like n=1 Tax=Sabethes cyaneus TaxID=53552 RepID=UPI00237DF624|nr:protein nessun dorma-like [Sabethes cyaneus]
MSEVHLFEKSLLTRMEETAEILSPCKKPVSASRVKNAWSNYTETVVASGEWQAVWRIPREFCEKLSIPYPTVVKGTVETVYVDELTAKYYVDKVQDENVRLDGEQTPSLMDLWPLKCQQNEDVIDPDAIRTADCLDKMRFFYQHLWMPWDRNDNCKDWAAMHLKSRIKFYHDLRTKTMSKRLSSYILALLNEAKYLQSKRDLLEQEAKRQAEIQELENYPTLPLLSTTRDLMEIHLRLCSIKTDIDVLENLSMRPVFEKHRFPKEINGFAGKIKAERNVLVVSHIGTLQEQIEYLEKVNQLANQMPVQMYDSLETAVKRCKPLDQIYLPHGQHLIAALEYFKKGSITGLSLGRFLDKDLKQLSGLTKEITVVSPRDNDSIFLTIDGDYCFENILFDCSRVEVGIMVKQGSVRFKNCCLIGDNKSDRNRGIVIFGNCNVRFKHCIIKDFAAGIYAGPQCIINLFNSVVFNCHDGIDAWESCRINFQQSEVSNCLDYGVKMRVLNYKDYENNQVICSTHDTKCLTRSELQFKGLCKFEGNGKFNFVLLNSEDANIAGHFLCNVLSGDLRVESDDSDDNDDSDGYGFTPNFSETDLFLHEKLKKDERSSDEPNK